MKRRGIGCQWLLLFPVFVLFAILVAVEFWPAPESGGEVAPSAAPDRPTADASPDLPDQGSPSVASPPPSSVDQPPLQIAFALLGGDYRPHREGTRYGNKTDVSLIVVVTLEDPVDIVIFQLPRNLYVPTSLGDYWQFAIYRLAGAEGYQQYIKEVMGLNVPVVAYIDMDRFVSLVDELGGIYPNVEVGVLTGADTLAYLRDNENNWDNCLYYDCEGRQFEVLTQLGYKVKSRFRENPLESARLFWQYKNYFELNIDEFEQFHYLVEIGWKVATSDYRIRPVRLTQSGVVDYGDTPLDVRGWIETGDIQAWVQEVLNSAN